MVHKIKERQAQIGMHCIFVYISKMDRLRFRGLNFIRQKRFCFIPHDQELSGYESPQVHAFHRPSPHNKKLVLFLVLSVFSNIGHLLFGYN